MGAPACHRRRPAQSLAPARTPPRVHPTRAEVGDKRGWPHPLVAPIRACLDDLLMSIAPGLFRRHRDALPAVPYACTSLPPAEPTGFHIQLAAQILVFASFENQSAPSPLCTNLHARRRKIFARQPPKTRASADQRLTLPATVSFAILPVILWSPGCARARSARLLSAGRLVRPRWMWVEGV